MVPDITGRVAIICLVSVVLSLHAVAQEGYYGVGHDRWHRDGGAHVCAPRQEGLNKGVVFCVVLPPEG